MFGLARNARLVGEIAAELRAACAEAEATGKAEWNRGEANARFIVTSLAPAEVEATAAGRWRTGSRSASST